MHSLLTILLGIVGAWACKRHNGADSLGFLWRLAAGATAGALPHIDVLFQFLTVRFGLAHHYAESWSLLLAPLYALGLAFAFQKLSGGCKIEDEGKHNWQKFYLPIFCGLFLALACSLLTSVGVMPLAPVLRLRLTADLIFMFDYVLLAILLLAVVLGLSLRAWVRDIARTAIVSLVVYFLVLLTFQYKASHIAYQYADVRHLEVMAIHTLPQPLSPLHWRLIIETKDARLYDTMVHLFLQEEREVREDTSRVGQIAALYKPVEKAWWRIYNRYGRDNTAFVKRGWTVFEASVYGWFARFAVYQRMEKYEGLSCAMMKDIRYEGARRDGKGTYLLCEEGDGWRLFRGRNRDDTYDFIGKLPSAPNK